MNDIQKMFQALINGQSAFRQEILKKIEEGNRKLEKRIDAVEKSIGYLTKRIDRIGRQLSYVEDDTPTREEYDQLEKRGDNLEQKAISA